MVTNDVASYSDKTVVNVRTIYVYMYHPTSVLLPERKKNDRTAWPLYGLTL